jgi:FtsZ-binding cell division protein ZapB
VFGYASYCTSAYVFCAVYLTAGIFRPIITTAPPASSFDSAPADGGKVWNKSAVRRQRVRQSARVDIAHCLQRHVDQLREKLAAVQQELVNEKDRRNAISAKHFTISHSLLRTQQLLDEARAFGEAG